VVSVSNNREADLEARVARLERLLDRVLELVQELKGGVAAELATASEEAAAGAEDPAAAAEEVPWEVLRAVGASAAEGVDVVEDEAVEEEERERIEEEEVPVEGVPPQEGPLTPPEEPVQELPDWYHRPMGVESAPSEAGAAAVSDSGDTGVEKRVAATTGSQPYQPKEVKSLLSDLGIWPPTEVFLSRLGIGILLLSVAFFFKYSIDQGWLVPAVRIAIGVAAGVVMVALGFRGASKGEPLGMALAGGGIATFFITGYTGHQWYSLVSYPVAFGFLFLASTLGIYLSLRSGLQALAIVGLIGALATPILLTAQTADVGGLALYVCLIVASVAAIYLAKAWRALFLLAVVTTWLVMGLAVSQAGQPPGVSGWVLQGGVVFCALAFWLVPLFRAELRARSPGRWLRPESAYLAGAATDEDGVPIPTEAEGPTRWFTGGRRSEAGTAYVPWNAHLDTLSLLMPPVAVLLSLWLWDLSSAQVGWSFLGAAFLAQGVGWWLSKSHDPEDSASTQWYAAIILSTIGLGLWLTGDVLYLAFIAEAVALMTVGARKDNRVVLGLGGAVELLVVFLFLYRFVFGILAGDGLVQGDLSALLDLAAIGGAVFIGTQLQGSRARAVFFVGAYLAFLLFTVRELADYPDLLYLAFLVEAVATYVFASRRQSELLENLGHVAFAIVVVFFATGFQSGPRVMVGEFPGIVDLAVLLGAVYAGTLASKDDVRRGFLAGAYLGLLALVGRELSEHLSLLCAAFIVAAVVTQVLAQWRGSSMFRALGHVPALVVLALFANGMEMGRSLSGDDLTSLVDLLAVGGIAYIGTLLTQPQGRLLYLFGAYAGLLLWTGRELYPLEQGQALMSLAFGLEGAAVLVAGFLLGSSPAQKAGMATLLMVVVKVMLVDLAAVEPIWRVLLLFVFGGLFLLLSKFIKGRIPDPPGG
jgi:hypothetical protein